METIPCGVSSSSVTKNNKSILWTWGIIFINFSWPQLHRKPLSVIENVFFININSQAAEPPPNRTWREWEQAWVGVVVSFIFLYSSASLVKVHFTAPRQNGMSIVRIICRWQPLTTYSLTGDTNTLKWLWSSSICSSAILSLEFWQGSDWK